MKILIPLLILFTSLFHNTSFASHAMGADLTYRCLGNNQYEITFSFYRDCSGIPAPSPMSITIHSSCYADLVVYLNPLSGSPTQISPICPSATSTCNGGAFIGIQEWIYQGVVTLPGPCVDWTFYHSESARNAAITTITGAGGDDLFVYSKMDNTNGLCNNSPIFSNRPVLFACIGQRFCFNHGAYDIDGDSLSFELITPRNGPNAFDTVQYLTGYSAGQPVISSPPVSINSSTGEICMIPTQSDVSVMAVLVNEYRQGVLISQIERDLQINIMPCANILPHGTGINGGPIANNQIYVCATLQNCFFITAVDPDTANSTSITWNESIHSMTANNSFGHRDTLYFCWTPSDSDTLTNPNCFTATTLDDNCPYLGMQTNTYCLIVQPSYLCNPNSAGSPLQSEIDVKIFPQPARDFITIKFRKPLNGQYYLVLHNILGESVFKIIINEQSTTINLNGILKDGIYFAGLSDAEGRFFWNHKLIFMN